MAHQLALILKRLIDGMTTLLLAELDAETRFLLRAERGRDRQNRGLELLEKAAAEDPKS